MPDHQAATDTERLRMKRTSRGLRAVLHPLFSMVLLAPLPGCMIIGALAAKVGPPPTIKAQYAPAKEPTLVLVENFHNPASLRLESDAVARNLLEELKMNSGVPVIEPVEVENLRQAKGAAYRKMPLDQISQAVGAKQVIYVDLQRFEIEQALASEQIGGAAEARVRVVNDAGEVLWPMDSAGGYPVSVRVEPQRIHSGLGDQSVRRQMHAALADRVAKLFYDWKAEGADGAEQKFQ